jgi:hypothetical protein
MSESMNSAAPHHLPIFVTGPDGNDVLMTVMAVFLVVAVLAVGILFLRLHTLPERIAHRGHKLQFEIVAVLGLLALFTHMHIFWVAGLLLALIDLPDFGVFNRMAGSLEKIAGLPPGQSSDDNDGGSIAGVATPEGAAEVPPTITPSRKIKERVHA